MPGPLEGITVLDFSTLLPGPLATLILADASADVIRIERPGGEDMRRFAPMWHGVSAPFALLNRGKRALAADLKDPSAVARLEPLIARADVLVEQFRPGVMARLGLGYERLAALNPRLVYCSISGYGQTGPKAHTPGHDVNYMAETGLLALSHGPASRPVLPPVQVADIGGGTYPAVINVLLALLERGRTGRGRHLDIAMTEGIASFAVFAQADLQAAGQEPDNGSGLLTGGRARYNLYGTADGRVVAVGALEDKFWAEVCAVTGLDERFHDDARAPEAAIAALAACFAREPASVWRTRFAGREACVSIVANLAEALADPHMLARGLYADAVRGPTGQVMPAIPTPVVPGLRARPQAGVPSLDGD